MARTTATAVQGLLLQDYDGKRNPPLTPFIDTASAWVDRLVTCAAAKDVTHAAAVLEIIERWLAAFFYTRSDPIYASRSTAGRSGSFVSDPLDPERYRIAAVGLDHTGCLEAMFKRQRAGAFWNGRPPSEQTDYADRD